MNSTCIAYLVQKGNLLMSFEQICLIFFNIYDDETYQNNVIDWSNTSSCFTSLFLHLELANYVARIWKLTLCASSSLLDINGCWIKWIQQAFPEDFSKLLIFDNDIDDHSENTFEDYGNDIESDSEDESGVISLV